MPPPPTQPSLLKTLSVTSALSCLIASKRSLIGKFIGKAAYTELNQALLAAYLLHNLSEVERRYGHVKFLKWVVVQFLVSRVPGLVFEGYDWIIFGLMPINYNLNWQPRAQIFNSIILLGHFLTGNTKMNLTTLYLLLSGLASEKITNSTSENKFINQFFQKISIFTNKIFKIVPGYLSTLVNDVNSKPNFPFLATSSWRRQEQMEKLERAQMQRARVAGQGVQFMQNMHLRQRQNAAFRQNAAAQQAAAAQRPAEFPIDQGKLENLKSMGFREDRIKYFLRQTNNDEQQAINFLLAEA